MSVFVDQLGLSYFLGKLKAWARGAFVSATGDQTVSGTKTFTSTIQGNASTASAVPWSGVTGKPSTFTPSAHNQASNTINAMTGYSKPSSTSAIGTSDTLNVAIGKLEKALDGKQASGSYAAASHNHDASNINSGTLNVARIPNLDASKITSGTIDIARLPAGALERLVTVADQTARFALTANDVQLGDTVKQLDTGLMYYVVDTSKLSSADGYAEYTAGAATSVPWSGVTGKPSSFTPSSHAHGNLTNDGKIGSTANLPLITTTSGKVTTGSFGTTANTFCQGNDSRLSDARTPTSHAHGSITNDGKLGTASRVVVTDGSKVIGVSSITTTKLGYLTDVTANIQGQIDGKADDSSVVHKTGDETVAGTKTFSSQIVGTIGKSVDNGKFADIIQTFQSDNGNKRSCTIRCTNGDGYNAISFGAHDESDSAPVGLSITNTDGVLTGRFDGSLRLTKITDASGTADNSPALSIGATSGTHLELDGNEIMAKASGTTTGTLYINGNGGDVYIGGNTDNYKSVTGRGKGSSTVPVYTNSDGIVTACGSSLDVDVSGNAATATKLGTSTVGTSVQPIYLNAGIATAVDSALKSCYAVVESEAVANNIFKIASGSMGVAYNGLNLVILIQNIMGGNAAIWRISLVASSTAGVFNKGTSVLVDNIGLDPANFIVAYKSNSGSNLDFELYTKIAARYAGYRFTVIQECWRSSQKLGNILTLYNQLTTTGTAAITSGYTALTTTKATVNMDISGDAATATKLATARTINGVSFDGSDDITVADSTKLPLTGGTLTGNVVVSKSNITRGTSTTKVDVSIHDVKDSAGNRVGLLQTEYAANKSSITALYAYDTTTATGYSTGKLGIGTDTTGAVYTVAPTPAFGDNTTKIATTEFVYKNAAKHFGADVRVYVALAATGDGSGSNTSNYMSLSDLRNYLATVHMHSDTGNLSGAYTLTLLFKAGDSFGNASFYSSKLPGIRNIVINTSTGTASTSSNYSTNSPTFGNITVIGNISATIRNVNCTGAISAQYGSYVLIDTYVAVAKLQATNHGYLSIAKNTIIDVVDAHTDYFVSATTYGLVAMWPGATVTLNFRNQCYYSRALFYTTANGTLWLGYSSLKLTGTVPISIWAGSGTLTGTSETAAGTAAKVVPLADGQTFTLATDATAKVRFTNDNTAANPTLNINSTGAKAIWWNGAAVAANMLAKNITYDVKYDGTHYVIQNAIKRLTNNDFGIFRTSGNYNQTYNSGSWNFDGWSLYYGTGIENSNWRGNHIGSIQQNVTASNNTYPVLITGTANATANTSTYPFFGTGVKINPKTSTVYATTFSGEFSGNASTATKLATPRTINGVPFDGSDDITVADSTKLPLTGGTLTDTLYELARNVNLSVEPASAKEDYKFILAKNTADTVHTGNLMRLGATQIANTKDYRLLLSVSNPRAGNLPTAESIAGGDDDSDANTGNCWGGIGVYYDYSKNKAYAFCSGISTCDLSDNSTSYLATNRWVRTATGNFACNAATATEFSANKSVTLTGDVTGTASSKAGWSIATTVGAITNTQIASMFENDGVDPDDPPMAYPERAVLCGDGVWRYFEQIPFPN